MAAEYFAQTKAFCQLLAGSVTPVVKVAGDNQRRIWFSQMIDVISQGSHLFVAGIAEERQVHADAIRWRTRRQFDAAMEQAAFFEAQMRHILIE